jgi:hypothetical protein
MVISHNYGNEEFGRVYSILQLSASAASLALPQIAGAAVKSTHSYIYMLFGIAGSLLFCAILLSISWKKPSKENQGYSQIN